MNKKLIFSTIFIALLNAGFTFATTSYYFFRKKDLKTLEIGGRINFQNKTGEFKFTAIPSMGRDHLMMERQFTNFKLKNNLNEDEKLYRVSRINYLNVSDWCKYKLMPEWQYPLLD